MDDGVARNSCCFAGIIQKCDGGAAAASFDEMGSISEPNLQ